MKEELTLKTLIENNTLSEADAALVTKELFDNRKCAVIYGGVGTGKTTLVEAIIRTAIRKNKRVVYLPVFTEMKFNTNVVTQEVGMENKEDVLLNTIGFSPDLTVVEEIRTPEELKQVVNLMMIGHQVIFTTHATSLQEFQMKCLGLLATDEKYTKYYQDQDFFLLHTNINEEGLREILIEN